MSMGLPNITITFEALSNTAVQRLARGTVGLILRDSEDNGACVLTRASQFHEKLPALGEINLEYIRRAFLGYVAAPSKVVVYVLPDDAPDFAEALTYMASQSISYLAGPPEISAGEISEIVAWVKDMRAAGATPKAVLPHAPVDDFAVINYTNEGISVGHEIYGAAEYCSRIAGLVAGTPPSISCTYAPLPEVSGVAPMTKEDMDAAVDRGEFILIGDGARVKVGRGVNSFFNIVGDKTKNDSFKKIKIVEIMDMINDDIRAALRDTYIGRYANSYDNKCLILSSINDYFLALEREGLLNPGHNSVWIDLEAQEAYLVAHGADIGAMSEQDIKEANTGSEVFLLASVSILDAVENVILRIRV